MRPARRLAFVRPLDAVSRGSLATPAMWHSAGSLPKGKPAAICSRRLPITSHSSKCAVLCYLIPGANGETEPGARRLNWVWYWNVAEAALPGFMTGRDARVRDFSVLPGQMREELVERQGAIAEEMFCPAADAPEMESAFAALFFATHNCV